MDVDRVVATALLLRHQYIFTVFEKKKKTPNCANDAEETGS